MATTPQFGQKIGLVEAQAMIQEHRNLKQHLETKINPSVSTSTDVTLQGKMAEFTADQQFNAFVFTKDLIMRFFDGSEVDDEGNPQASNYLVVILGAHDKAKKVNNEDFKAGSNTVLTAGCIKKQVMVGGKMETRFYPLSTPEPANEYPPRTIITLDLEVSSDPQLVREVTYFKVL